MLNKTLFLGMKFCKQFFVLFLFFCSTAIAQQNHYISFETGDGLKNFLTWKEGQFPLISAHRGGPMKGFPENCIETFENATTYNPMIIEFDVALSRDSVLVIMHDDRLDRTTTGTGPVGAYSYAELQQLRLKDPDNNITQFKIPTLDEVLAWAKGKVLLTIDVKKGVPFSKVVAAVRRQKAENCSIVITYNANQAAEVHNLAPDLMISVSANKKEDVERLNSLGVPNNRMVAFVGTREPDKESYRYLHSQGITCILGTMGNLDKSAASTDASKVYGQLVENGANILSTDNIALASEQLNDLRKRKNILKIR